MKRIVLSVVIAALPGTALAQSPRKALPAEPGMYVVSTSGFTKILGQPVTFERTGSRLVSGLTLHIKAAHNNIQLPGRHAQTVTSPEPVFAFIPSQREAENGVTAGDLVLIKLETHGDRRQIEIAAGGSWRGSAGVSITHQVAAVRSEPASGKHEIRPASPFERGEYALYLQRGEGLPAMLYDFSVQERADFSGEIRDRELGGTLAISKGPSARTPIGTPAQTPAASEAPSLGVSGYATEQGFTITSVRPGSPAQQAGIKLGDVIAKIDERQVRSGQDIESAISASTSGAINLTYWLQSGWVIEREVKVR